jgi:4-hydroxybenzoate polyprenyltransferase/phosphoserine phosphatase
MTSKLSKHSDFACDNKVIVVDLDGTLISSDMLVENMFLFLRYHPLRFFELLTWLIGGKSYFKRRLVDAIVPGVEHLPYNKDLLAWLRQQSLEGAQIVLATSSDQRIANAVASHLGIFNEIFGSGVVNLSSKQKRDVLVERFGEKRFEYIGNSRADLSVWEFADLIHIVNPEFGVLAAANKIGPIKTIFENRPPYLKSLIKTLRIHQWAKNLLILVPLLASHRIFETHLIFNGMLAFIAFGLCASSVYLLNDLLDLPDDRQHSSKCNRPLAAGTFPIVHALFLIPVLLLAAFFLALFFLPISFVVVLFAYYVLTLIYSLWLKRMVMIDVIVLAMLYTIRVLAGAAAMSLEATFWILAFCMFIFLSLAFVKRYTELCDARHKKKAGLDKALGRGYYPADFELLASLGGASGYISVLVLALYINDAAAGFLYRDQRWMWTACPLLMFWLSRVWLLAHRGQMHDDPILFALRDNVSRFIGLSFILVFVLATL